MKRFITIITSLAVLAATLLTFGLTAPANATPAATLSPTSQVSAPVNTKPTHSSSAAVVPVLTRPAVASRGPWDGLAYTAVKTANFAACIFGVGVPIGLVWAFATNPLVWRFVLGMGPLPATSGSAAARYLSWVKARCIYALR